MFNNTLFGARLKELRKSRGHTQSELAEIIGVEQATIGKYEVSANAAPSVGVLLRLADYFAVSTDYLLGRSEAQIGL